MQQAGVREPIAIVGIGASAGGLRALEEFFRNVPLECEAAFVVIQHLSPDFKSVMQELLSRHTTMEVLRAEDGMPLRPRTVYLIPPKKNLSLDESTLKLTDQDLSPGHSLAFAINVFFESLAKNARENSIGVILSGTGTDGTQGSRAINEAGGLVLAQEPKSAEFDGMPRSVIQSGMVHRIAKPNELPVIVAEYLKNPNGKGSHPVSDEYKVEHILRLISQEEGSMDLTNYRHTTAARRIARRMFLKDLSSPEAYIALLTDSGTERAELRNDLLINVTRFFRDAHVWSFLEQDVIPEIVRNSSPAEVLRLWSAGCATGEEAYSLAILLCEAMDQLGIHRDVKIFATDASKNAIDHAGEGTYQNAITADLTRERVTQFFQPKGQGLQVTRRLREMVIVARHDLGRDAPFSKMHFASCRNVLIYMQPVLQQRVLTNLHFALLPKAHLLLGAAENIGPLEAEFETVNRKSKIFRKTGNSSYTLQPNFETSFREPVSPTPRSNLPALREGFLQRSLESFLKDEGSAVLLVDSKDRLLYAFGSTEKYLRLPQGKQTSEIAKLVVDPLTLALGTSINRARRESDTVLYEGINIGTQDSPSIVSIKTWPTTDEEHVGTMGVLIKPLAAGATSTSPSFDPNTAAAQRVSHLEFELQRSKESLQATIEELETANEEQQSSNEELLASNEELQSTNEELQSVNEELHTVNSEYQQKITELTELTLDFDNLLASTNIGTVFLDPDLRVRRFTPAAREAINLLPSDIGRPITHLSSTLKHDFVQDLRDVLSSGESKELRVNSAEGQQILLRIHPYLDDGQTEGIVLTLVNIDPVHAMEKELLALLEEVEALNDQPIDATTPENSMLILLVEDEAGDSELISRHLGQQVPCTVDSAASMDAARGRLAKSTYDLVILDLRLPDGSGLELLDLLNGTPAIAISGSEDTHLITEITRTRVFGFLLKNSDAFLDLLSIKAVQAFNMYATRRALKSRLETLRATVQG